MNLLRLLLILLAGWLVARLVKGYLAKTSRKTSVKSERLNTDLVKCPVCGTYSMRGVPHICGGKAALLVLVLFFSALAHPAVAAGGGRYLVEVVGSNVTVNVDVNGLHAERWSLPRETTAGASLNHWLRQGNNTLSIKAEPSGAGRPAVKVRVYFMGLTATGAANIVNLLEVADQDKAQRGVSVSFNLASAPSLTLWQTTSPAAALSADQAATLVATLRQELISVAAVGGGFEDVSALDAERKDIQKAYGAATSQPLAATAQNPQSEVETVPAPSVADLALDRIDGTGLVRLARKDRSPLIAIRQQKGGQVMAVPAVIVGWVGGAWQILRRAY